MALSKPRAGEIWGRLASGIEAGIVGGAAMLVIYLSASLWDGHVWWEAPNLLGSTFYGVRAFRSGTGLATVSGVALHFVITGTLGGLFGLAFGGIRERGRLVMLGLLVSIGWYNVASAIFWPKINPWVLAASPRPVTVVSHVLLGACLGYMGQRYKFGYSAATADRMPPPAQLDFVLPQSSPEVPGGEADIREVALPDRHLAIPEEPLVAECRQPQAGGPSDGLE